MLCLAARQHPIGFVCMNGESLNASDIAHYVRVSEPEVSTLMAELDRNGVLTRDRNGRIYSRRMVRDGRQMALDRKNGAKGGNPSLLKQRKIPPPAKGGVNPPIKARYQNPDTNKQDAHADARAPLLAACDAMGTNLEALRRKPAWMAFGDFYHELVGQGCMPARDIWPTIARLSARLGGVPSSPLYFKTAILAARDGHTPSGPPSPQEVAERLALYAREGVWSSKWGPKPDDGASA